MKIPHAELCKCKVFPNLPSDSLHVTLSGVCEGFSRALGHSLTPPNSPVRAVTSAKDPVAFH